MTGPSSSRRSEGLELRATPGLVDTEIVSAQTDDRTMVLKRD